MRLRDEGLSWQEIDGELVILDLKSSVYLTTNKPGAFLAKLLVEEREPEDLVNALIEQYRIDRDRAVVDADAFVQELRRKGLLVEQSG